MMSKETDPDRGISETTPVKHVFVKTLGCKVNTFDSQALEGQFQREGYQLVGRQEDADVTVINTCSVTAAAEREARYLLRRYRRENPSAFRVVTGCYAQIDSGNIAEIEEVDFVVPNEARGRLVQLVGQQLDALRSGHPIAEGKIPQGVTAVRDNRQSHFKSSLTFFDSPVLERSRAFLKIQDGCNGFCSYCQIPWARGASRSVPPVDVLRQLRKLLDNGVAEIVLTGIHIGDYGEDLGEEGKQQGLFLSLLEDIFAETKLRRLRISSLEPAELTEDLIRLLARHREQFCEHFHLPMQSGDDRILKKMNRSYSSEQYRESVRLIRHYFPEAQISADVIPGFPGEGDEEFASTEALIRSCQLSSLHVFPYSERPNTAALRMPDHVPPPVRKQRAARLRQLSAELAAEYARKFFGQSMTVLWEKKQASGRWEGKTRNYLQILSPENFQAEPGTESDVILKGFLEHGKILGIPAC